MIRTFGKSVSFETWHWQHLVLTPCYCGLPDCDIPSSTPWILRTPGWFARSSSFVIGMFATSVPGQDMLGSVLVLITLIEACFKYFSISSTLAAESTNMNTVRFGSGSIDPPLRWLASLVAW